MDEELKHVVSTAAWACIEFLQREWDYAFYKAMKSQQPLGLVLSFYFALCLVFSSLPPFVSTAAWACIEFLLSDRL